MLPHHPTTPNHPQATPLLLSPQKGGPPCRPSSAAARPVGRRLLSPVECCLLSPGAVSCCRRSPSAFLTPSPIATDPPSPPLPHTSLLSLSPHPLPALSHFPITLVVLAAVPCSLAAAVSPSPTVSRDLAPSLSLRDAAPTLCCSLLVGPPPLAAPVMASPRCAQFPSSLAAAARPQQSPSSPRPACPSTSHLAAGHLPSPLAHQTSVLADRPQPPSPLAARPLSDPASLSRSPRPPPAWTHRVASVSSLLTSS